MTQEVLTQQEGSRIIDTLKLCRFAVDVDDFDRL